LVLIVACVCGRGVKLDELIEKSDDLSASSKMFYTTAKKHNQCCDIM
jgi:synaptobrevin family protein YKT6